MRSHRLAVPTLACLSMLLAVAPAAQATVTYSYTGNTYSHALFPYDLSDRVTVTLTLANPIPANATEFDVLPDLISYEMSDGVYVQTEANPAAIFLARVTTNSAGAIVGWGISVQNVTTNLAITCAGGVAAGFCNSARTEDLGFDVTEAVGIVTDAPGSWTGPPPAVPALGAAGRGALLLFLIVATSRHARQSAHDHLARTTRGR